MKEKTNFNDKNGGMNWGKVFKNFFDVEWEEKQEI